MQSWEKDRKTQLQGTCLIYHETINFATCCSRLLQNRKKKHQMDVNELIKISEICFTIFFWLVYSHTVLMRSRLYLGSWDSLGNLHKENYILIPWTL
jgi:hypothetical protein